MSRQAVMVLWTRPIRAKKKDEDMILAQIALRERGCHLWKSQCCCTDLPVTPATTSRMSPAGTVIASRSAVAAIITPTRAVSLAASITVSSTVVGAVSVPAEVEAQVERPCAVWSSHIDGCFDIDRTLDVHGRRDIHRDRADHCNRVLVLNIANHGMAIAVMLGLSRCGGEYSPTGQNRTSRSDGPFRADHFVRVDHFDSP